MYCGYDILIYEKNHLTIEHKDYIEDLLALANVAEDAKNYRDAYKYFSQVLEQDATVIEAWIGKGIAAGWQSSVQSQRIDEAIGYFKKGLQLIQSNELDETNQILIRVAALNLSNFTSVFTRSVAEYLQAHYDEYIQPRGGAALDPLTAGIIIGTRRPEAEKQVNAEFLQNLSPVIVRGITFAWDLFKDESIAKSLYGLLRKVNDIFVLTNETKSNFERDLQQVIVDVKDKLPDFQPPKKKSGCFIATATMGDYNHPYVIELRNYRDQKLYQTNLGKVIIQIYYRLSPPIAKFIEKSAFLKALSLSFVVKPSVFFVRHFDKK